MGVMRHCRTCTIQFTYEHTHAHTTTSNLILTALHYRPFTGIVFVEQSIFRPICGKINPLVCFFFLLSFFLSFHITTLFVHSFYIQTHSFFFFPYLSSSSSSLLLRSLIYTPHSFDMAPPPNNVETKFYDLPFHRRNLNPAGLNTTFHSKQHNSNPFMPRSSSMFSRHDRKWRWWHYLTLLLIVFGVFQALALITGSKVLHGQQPALRIGKAFFITILLLYWKKTHHCVYSSSSISTYSI